jgi:hypothetical protein
MPSTYATAFAAHHARGSMLRPRDTTFRRGDTMVHRPTMLRARDTMVHRPTMLRARDTTTTTKVNLALELFSRGILYTSCGMPETISTADSIKGEESALARI